MQKWNSKVQFPSDSCFVNRVTDATFGPSNSSGNPMLTLTCEVVSPATYEIGTETYNIAGVQTKNYYTTAVQGDDERTAECQKRFKALWELFGLDPNTINWDNPDVSPLRGKLILTQMSPDIEPQRKNPTAAQIEAAKKTGARPEGDVQKHPVTGAPLINYWPKIREIFGLAPQQDGVQMPY